MSAIRLLVLNAVRQHGRAHGYQVRNDLEYWGAHEWSNAKPGSIYHALKQLAKQGFLHAHEVAPSTVGGPPRTEYEITDWGNEEYFRLLREALTSYDQQMDVKSAAIGGSSICPGRRRWRCSRSGPGGSTGGGRPSPSTTSPRTGPNSSATSARS